MLMLENIFQIKNQRDPQLPIQVKIKGNLILIDLCMAYNRAALAPWQIDGLCQADLIEAAIIRQWSGAFRLRSKRFKGIITARTKVRIHRKILNYSRLEEFFHRIICPEKSGRKPVRINIRRMLIMPAHVISPWYRRFWGILLHRQWESIGTNWSRKSPGIMVLPPCEVKSLQWFERMAAHEAGHLFGIGDAYGALYRYYYDAPGTMSYMMNSNRRVHSQEIIMQLQAHESGKMQYFPKKWDKNKFVLGFRREIQAIKRQLARK